MSTERDAHCSKVQKQTLCWRHKNGGKKETKRERIMVVISGQVKTHGYTIHRELLGLCKMSK